MNSFFKNYCPSDERIYAYTLPIFIQIHFLKKKSLQFLKHCFPLLYWNPISGGPSPYSFLNWTHNSSLISLFLRLYSQVIYLPFCYMWLVSACTMSLGLTQQFQNDIFLLCLIITVGCNSVLVYARMARGLSLIVPAKSQRAGMHY